MAFLGVILAVVWQTSLWSDPQRWLALAAGLASGTGNPVEEQLSRITGELDVLKRNMNEFRAAQQQTSANVAFLQATQQEFQQRVSSLQGGAWYADLAALTYPTPAAKKPPATASDVGTAGGTQARFCRRRRRREVRPHHGRPLQLSRGVSRHRRRRASTGRADRRIGRRPSYA
jgi:hypothetical protein